MIKHEGENSQGQLHTVPHNGQHDTHHEREDAAVYTPDEAVKNREADMPLRAHESGGDNSDGDDGDAWRVSCTCGVDKGKGAAPSASQVPWSLRLGDAGNT